MSPRTISAAVGTMVTLLAALAAPAAVSAQTQAKAPGPHLGLIAVQQSVTIPKLGKQPVLVDPDVWVASYGSAFRLDVKRASYTKPVTITRIISTPQGADHRQLPGSALDGWNGLKDFIHFTLSNAKGKVVVSRQITFCPDLSAERANPVSPATDPYPSECGSLDPFPVGEIWGLPEGWAVDPFGSFSIVAPGPLHMDLAIGKYRATVSIAPQYRTLFGVSAGAATTTVGINVVDAKNCSPTSCGTARLSATARPTGSGWEGTRRWMSRGSTSPVRH
jgi:hypothetical protein